MTTLEISNNITNKRIKYEDNIAIIGKLKKMLVEDNSTSKKLIEEAILKVQEEQEVILKEFNVKSIGELLIKEKKAKENVKFANMRKFKYKSLSSKDIESLMSYRKGNDDITEVLTSDMKKEQEDNKDKTEVLTSDTNKKDIYKDARIVFRGGYYLHYNNGNNSYYCNLNEDVLKNNYDINGTYDFNIIKWLKDIDKNNNTNFYDYYMNHKIPVFYDFEATRKNRPKNSKKTRLSNANIKKLKTIVNREKADREFTNITSKDVKKKKFGVIAATVGLAAMTLLGAFGFSKTKKVLEDRNVATVSTVDDAGVTDAGYEDIELSETTMINTNVDSIELEEKTEETEETIDFVVEPEVEENDSEEEGLKVGDIIKLNNDDLYYTSFDSSPRGNTSYLESDKGKVGLIAIVYKGDVLEVIDDNSVSTSDLEKEFKAKYGDDIKVSVNVDLVDDNGENLTKYLGWMPNEETEDNEKVLIR